MTRLLAALSARPADPDRALLGRWAAARDEAAFAELLRRHGPLVWAVCRRQLANPADAEDAFQAAFLVLARRADSVPGCVGAWLHRVAVLTCRNVRRANRRRPTASLPSDIAVSPADDRVEVDDLLNRLPERDRRAVVLCHLLGFTRTEAASELGIPEGTLSARLSRGLTKLRRAAGLTPAGLAAGPVPAAVLAATARAVGVWEATAVGLSPAATGAATGVLRMFWVKKLTAATVLLTALVAGGLGVAMTAEPPAATPAPPPAAKLPRLAGRWAVHDADLGYANGRTEFVVTLTEAAVAGVEDGDDKWKAGELTRDDRRLRFSATSPNGVTSERVEAVQDPATPDQMGGSKWSGSRVERVVFRRLAAGAEPPQPGPVPGTPVARQEWLKLAIAAHHAVSFATAPSRKHKPADEQAKLVAAAVEAQTQYTAAEPGLLRKLVADEPNSVHGFDAARELIRLAGWQSNFILWGKLDAALGQKPGTVQAISKLDATAVEAREWVGVVRRFAATHGPQFEAGVLTEVAKNLGRNRKYRAVAVELAPEADKLATAAGMPPEAGKLIMEREVEAAAWAKQKNPPAAGSVWTATVRGRVTDAAGKPIPGASVVVNNLQGVRVLLDDKSNEVKTDAGGRYTAVVKCQGEQRLHVTGMWAEAKGYVKRTNSDRHSLLPGEVAEVNFTLAAGEKFAGVLKLSADDWAKFAGTADGTASVWVRGPDVGEWLVLKNGERFELYLPAGKYAVTLDGVGGEKKAWEGLATGAARDRLPPRG